MLVSHKVIDGMEAGIVECYWAEDDGYYCQCDKGSMQPQDVEPY
ncbi:hypothetical protein ACWOHD_004456 [Vibrio parahaemolyticus]